MVLYLFGNIIISRKAGRQFSKTGNHERAHNLRLIRGNISMGKVYKDKKSKGCALCKPHKHGWSPKKKEKVRSKEKEMETEIRRGE